MITFDQIESLVQRIITIADPDKIILFGSYATGSNTADSDVDLLIIKPSSEERHTRTRNIRRALRNTKIPLDLVVYTPEEIAEWQNVSTAFITRILEEGKVMYENQV